MEKINKTSGEIFRVQLRPFYWYGEKKPHIKFHRHLYRVYADILQKLKDNETIKNNKLRVQLWLFYPRTVRSLIIVAQHEQYLKRNGQIDAKETSLITPQLFGNSFNTFKLKIGNDNIFEPIGNNNENTKWLTHRQGEVWTIE